MRSEAERYLMQGRMVEGMRHKARRGERRHHPPMGYVRGPDGDSQLAPDEQAQRGIRVIFDPFEGPGSRPGVLRSLGPHDMRLPSRPHGGPNRGQRVWRRPTRMTWHPMRPHPVYAGASRWGHRQRDPRKQQPGRRRSGRTINVPEACDVRIPHRFPAYISGERGAAIQRRLADHRAIADA